LVSINVPSDKARAVVDAMERDMLTQLAGKSDLENPRSASKADFENLRAASKADLEDLRAASKADLENLRSAGNADLENLRLAVKGDIDAMGARLDALRQEVRMQQELLRSSMTIRLGSMFVVGLSLLFAALKLTGP
jgi:uncharacterized protein HemX